MKNIYLILIYSITVKAAFEVSSIFSSYNPSLLLRTFGQMKGHVREVENFDEITPIDLLRHGVIKIRESSSVVTSEKLASAVVSKNYFPSSLIENNKQNIFYEVSFEEIVIDKSTSEWIPLSPCHYNNIDSNTTYSQGWSVSYTGGVSSYVTFASILGITPKFQYDTSFSSSASGSLLCNVLSNKTLQFQIKIENLHVSGVKERAIVVSRDYPYTLGYFATMKVGEWEEVNDFEVLNKKKIETACVTNEMMLKCEDWHN